MTNEEIHAKLTEVFRDVFDNPGLEIEDSTTAADIEDWDSITPVASLVMVTVLSGETRSSKSMACPLPAPTVLMVPLGSIS